MSVNAAPGNVDRKLYNHTRQMLKSKYQHESVLSQSPGQAKKLIVVLPAQMETMAVKPFWPVRKEIDCSKQKCIALTFDDGPSVYTSGLLDILKSKNAKATFFVVGSRVVGSENILQRMINDGHEIGNHSFSHSDFRFIDQARIDAEIMQTQQAIKQASGYEPHIFRPPYGALPPNISGQLMQYPSVLWDNDPEDWERRTHDVTAGHVSGHAVPGGIVLMHDLYPETINAVPIMIDSLKAQGFELVTVSELMEWQPATQLPKGQIVKNR